MSRTPWGHVSRYCVYCGKVGPRTMVPMGWAHKRCIPKEVLKLLRKTKEKNVGLQGFAVTTSGTGDEGGDAHMPVETSEGRPANHYMNPRGPRILENTRDNL